MSEIVLSGQGHNCKLTSRGRSFVALPDVNVVGQMSQDNAIRRRQSRVIEDLFLHLHLSGLTTKAYSLSTLF